MTQKQTFLSKPIQFKNWFFKLSFLKKIALVLCLILVGFLSFKLIQPAEKTTTALQTAQVERKNLMSTLSVTGSIATGSQAEVNSTVTGVVDELYVKNGDTVTASQKLFKVTSTATPQEKAAAYASYQSALSSYKNAEQNKASLDVQMWQKRQSLLNAQNEVNAKNDTPDDYNDLERQSVDNGLVQSQKDFAAAETKYKEADIALTAAKASLNSALLSYQASQNAVVTAPTSGIVANLSIQKGDIVNANGGNANSSDGSTSSSNSTPTMYLTNFGQMEMTASVNEVDVPKVKVGQKVTVTLDAFTDKTFAGEVSRIDRIGTNSSGVVTFNVYITLVSVPEEVGSGMTASAVIQIDQRQNVLAIPTSALQSIGDQLTVTVLKENDETEQRTVETGFSTETEIEITSGLNENETVVSGSSLSSSTQRTQSETTSPFSAGMRGTGGGGSGFAPTVRMAR